MAVSGNRDYFLGRIFFQKAGDRMICSIFDSMQVSITALGLVLTLAVGGEVRADTVDIGNLSPDFQIDGLHSPNGVGYGGQTFTAVQGKAQSVTFQLFPTYFGPVRNTADFRVILTDIAFTGNSPSVTTNLLYPTAVLFDSGNVTIPTFAPSGPFSPFNDEAVTISLGNTQLQAGRIYGLLIDILSSQNPTDFLLGANERYGGGAFFYYANGSPTGNRSVDFGDTAGWISWGYGSRQPATSLAFDLKVAADPVVIPTDPGSPATVPLPSTALLGVALLGGFGLLQVSRQRMASVMNISDLI